MVIVGLTGSIGMGKSTTAKMFADAGVPVNDADQTVHELYSGPASPLIEAAFPGTTSEGVVDRSKLSQRLAEEPTRFAELEAIVHPLVQAREREFVERSRRESAALIVLDIPLLFEAGAEKRVDKIVVVSCDAETQKKRVLGRPGMTEQKFEMILSRQMPDAEKRKSADFVIDTGKGFEQARAQVADIISILKAHSGQDKR